ncbi:MAG TPA: arsenate reductase ArsC [Erysipelothrix sp.]|nr:arsenate reductase ArsC [Erysipelothrix sp.]
MDKKIRVLFVCVQNSFRSQMAQAIMNQKYGERFLAESAGINTGKINPLAIQVMKEIGLDISQAPVDSVFDFYKEGRLYSYVITVCSKEAEKKCPVFPGIRKRINWPLEDPATYEGSEQERYQKAVEIRDEIEKKIDAFVESVV